MVGKRQHYVPRLLQRGFLHSHDEGAERTWLHRNGAKAKLVGIADIGVEDWFYSRTSSDDSPTLDDMITELEGDLAKTVNGMRSAAPGDTVASDVAARCVVHLVTRTNHLRGVLSEGVERLTSEAESLFTDFDRFSDIIGLDRPELSQIMVEGIQESALKLVTTGVPSSLAERVMSVLVRENGRYLVRNAVVTVAPLFRELFGGLTDIVRDAHKRILETPSEASGWVSRLEAFHWTITAGEELILPDAIALVAEADGRLVPLLFTRGEDAEAVVLPIASNRALVGICTCSTAINMENFNKQAAAASNAFFIGACPYDTEKLSDLIGSGPSSAIESAVSEAIISLETNEAAVPEPQMQAEPWALEQKGFSYSVTLAGYGDMDLAKELGEVTQIVVSELVRHLPLYDLDGLTLAADYGNAIEELDRGDGLPAETSNAPEYGAGVAKIVSVRRNGLEKQHVVIDAGIAKSWLSEDTESRAHALNILIKTLAVVAHTTKFVKDYDLTLTCDPLTTALLPVVSNVPSGWFSARESAFISPNTGRKYVELVIDALEFADREIEIERVKAIESGDFEHVTCLATECVAAILTYSADWLGHRAGLTEGQSFDGDDLPEQLRSRGLDRWLELFNRDLSAVYKDENESLDMVAISRLSQHAERLLWFFGVFPWMDREDIRCQVAGQGFVFPRFF